MKVKYNMEVVEREKLHPIRVKRCFYYKSFISLGGLRKCRLWWKFDSVASCMTCQIFGQENEEQLWPLSCSPWKTASNNCRVSWSYEGLGINQSSRLRWSGLSKPVFSPVFDLREFPLRVMKAGHNVDVVEREKLHRIRFCWALCWKCFLLMAGPTKCYAYEKDNFFQLFSELLR